MWWLSLRNQENFKKILIKKQDQMSIDANAIDCHYLVPTATKRNWTVGLV